MYRQTVVGRTKAGKDIAYGVRDNQALYTIYFVKGGQVPEELSGQWNDTRQIETAITTYLNKDKLCKADQAKKDYKKSITASKKRPNKLKHKEKNNG